VEHNVRNSKGEMLDAGTTGIVERLPSGDVVKSPWTGSSETMCRDELILENRIYKILGPHPRLVKIIAWDAKDCVLTMEYMSNGCLRDYLTAHNDEISTGQRLCWAQEAAEGLQLLHSAQVLHCDVGPKNFLLDGDLNLRIADFSGSSLEGSRPAACASTRFLPPSHDFRLGPSIQEDLYALGSTIYTIITGRPPFEELDSDEVKKCFRAHTFPDVTEILCGEIIQRCWNFKVASAQEVYDFVRDLKESNLEGW
jgi:serine/threonine protein kinase